MLFCLHHVYDLLQEKFADTKGVIRSRKSDNDRQCNGQTMIYKTLHRKLNTNPTKNLEWTHVFWKGYWLKDTHFTYAINKLYHPILYHVLIPTDEE